MKWGIYMKISKIEFKDTLTMNNVYCIETPKTIFKYSNSPVILVQECDDYGKPICDSIYTWESIKCIYEMEIKKQPENHFINVN